MKTKSKLSIRDAFKPKPGSIIIHNSLSQIEIRMAAWMDQGIAEWLEKENEKLQKLQDKYDKDIKKTQKALNKIDQYQGQGIPASQIPYSDQDLYILKSEIVPPVCPACPTLNCGDCKTQAPPCPPCARCPEPAFDCKKVPNYKAAQTNPYLPRPWLNDFSQFGNHP